MHFHDYDTRGCSICCIIPEFISANIIKNGSPMQRERMLRNLSLNHTLSNARIGFSEYNRVANQYARLQRLAQPRSPLQSSLTGVPNRTIYTAKNRQQEPGNIVFSDNNPDNSNISQYNDLAVQEAYNYMGTTYDFYWQIFRRDSIDNAGLPLNGTVHYGQGYDNAYWDGKQMVFGDGDDEQFFRFTISVDVIAHELTHGVTQHEAGLIYLGQSGALNESISDVFGSLVKQYMNKQTAATADWLIGQGLFTPSVKGQAIRSLMAPGTAFNDPVMGKDPQPAHMSNYDRTHQDNGGVHINSGIPNHAFYLAATAIGGYAWETVGRIWYETLTREGLLSPTAQFQDFANKTYTISKELFPQGSVLPEGTVPNVDIAKAVIDAWASVGIFVSEEPSLRDRSRVVARSNRPRAFTML